MIKTIFVILIIDFMVSTGYNIFKEIPHKQELLSAAWLIFICTFLDIAFYAIAERTLPALSGISDSKTLAIVCAFCFVVLLNLMPWRPKKLSKTSMMCIKASSLLIMLVALFFLSADASALVSDIARFLLGEYGVILFVLHIAVAAALVIITYLSFVDTSIKQVIAAAQKSEEVCAVLKTYHDGRVTVSTDDEFSALHGLMKYKVIVPNEFVKESKTFFISKENYDRLSAVS